MFHLKSLIEPSKSVPATRQKQWQLALTTLFDQQRKYSAKSLEAHEIIRAPALT